MKYFVISDMHGFFKETKKALDEAKYDYLNPNHMLIVCGDIFDRGDEPLEMYKYLRSIPKDRRILIRGNHEYLLKEMTLRGFAMSHDYSNGTVDTFIKITDFDNNHYENIASAKDNEKLNEILDWIDSDEWVDFYEVDKYIFTHAFIPLYNHNKYGSYYGADPYTELTYISKWRNIKDRNIIEGSTWGCPWKNYLAHLFDEEAKKGKILVCGHWHSYEFFEQIGGLKLDKEYMSNREKNAKFEIFRGQNIIAIDSCTAYCKKVNVLIINEDFNPYIIKDNKEEYLEIFKDAF